MLFFWKILAQKWFPLTVITIFYSSQIRQVFPPITRLFPSNSIFCKSFPPAYFGLFQPLFSFFFVPLDQKLFSEFAFFY